MKWLTNWNIIFTIVYEWNVVGSYFIFFFLGIFLLLLDRW
jgi:hypothetical protein